MVAAGGVGGVDPDFVGGGVGEACERECFGSVGCSGAAVGLAVAALDRPGEGVALWVVDGDAPGEAEGLVG